jgi:thiol-disulfide isomerase/thioredoxin
LNRRLTQRRLLALLLSMAALAIAWRVGLPLRADYTGQIVGSLRVAPELGAYAPPLRLRSLYGAWIDSATLPRPLLLNFWATWCEPCQREMPDLQQIHAEGLAYVLAVNQGESAELVRAWLSAYGLSLPVALDAEDLAMRLYRVNGLPMSFIIAPDGTIGAIFYGAVEAERLRAALLPYQPTN